MNIRPVAQQPSAPLCTVNRFPQVSGTPIWAGAWYKARPPPGPPRYRLNPQPYRVHDLYTPTNQIAGSPSYDCLSIGGPIARAVSRTRDHRSGVVHVVHTVLQLLPMPRYALIIYAARSPWNLQGIVCKTRSRGRVQHRQVQSHWR